MGGEDGDRDGGREGLVVGVLLGERLGAVEGGVVGFRLGLADGLPEGFLVGDTDGLLEGPPLLRSTLGLRVGDGEATFRDRVDVYEAKDDKPHALTPYGRNMKPFAPHHAPQLFLTIQYMFVEFRSLMPTNCAAWFKFGTAVNPVKIPLP